MLDNLMRGVAGILILASLITVSPALCVIGLVLAVFGLCGFYESEDS